MKKRALIKPAFGIDSLERVRRPGLALALLVPAPTVGALMALWVLPGTVGGGIYALAKFWLLALPLVWTIAVCGRTPRRAVETGEGSAREGLKVGAALGCVIAAGIIGGFFMLRGWIDATQLRQTAGEAGFGTVRNYVVFGIYLSVVNSLLEEYVWRWFTFRATASLMPAALAVPVSAAFFTAHHVVVLAAYFPAWLTAVTSAGVFIGGCTWSWCYSRYRSVWPGYVSHAIVDVAILVVGWMLLFE